MDKFYETIERKKRKILIEEKERKFFIKCLICSFIISLFVNKLAVNDYITNTHLINTECIISNVEPYLKNYVSAFEVTAYNKTVLAFIKPEKRHNIKLENIKNVTDCIVIKYYDEIDIVIKEYDFNMGRLSRYDEMNNLFVRIFIFSLFWALVSTVFTAMAFVLNECTKKDMGTLPV